MDMQQFDEQINCIKQKLLVARNIDSEFRVFGAGGHKYILHSPVSEDEITRFETTHSIELPKCCRLFIGKVGNGGINSTGSAAGPYFGIFPFGENVNYLIYHPEKYLRNECKLFPGMSDQAWETLTERIASDDPISDKDYEVEIGKIFGGILPLGLQGCSFIHALIINGEYAGRVVNIDVSMSKPHFADEKTFLDWYEGWLNEIISGHLLQAKAIWFGYGKNETDSEL
jgi:hypothetical protein